MSFKTKRIIWLGMFPPEIPSVGDHAQTVAIRKWFKDYFPNKKIITFYRTDIRKNWDKIRKIINRNDLIFIHSSGDFGTLNFWTGETIRCWHRIRKNIIRSFPHNKIILMPVTVFYHNNLAGKIVLTEDKEFFDGRKNIILMAREKESYKILKKNLNCKSFLIPDFVFYLKPILKNRQRHGALLALRSDHEARFRGKKRIEIKEAVKKIIPDITIKDVQVASCSLTYEIRKNYINRLLDYYQSFEVIITDRMHGLIFSAITKTPCVAIDDKIPHKISGHKDWFSPSTKFVRNIEEIPNAIKEVLSKPYQENKDLTTYFSTLKEKIFSAFQKDKFSEYKIKPEYLMELIKGRRSIRKWLDTPVEEEKIEKILEAGMWAPTACNAQKVRLYTIRDKITIAKICRYSAPWFKIIHPKIIIAVLFDKMGHHPAGDFMSIANPWKRFIWQDTSAAMMNMMLMAEALGLKTCWQSILPPQLGNNEEKIRQILKIPDRYVLTCFLMIGYSNRKPDVKTHKHWGTIINRNKERTILRKL